MTSSPIELAQVSKSFGAVQALRGVSLTVAPGEMFGLIGHNGAGKSTLFKLMLGLLPATSGTVRVQGVDTASPEFRQVRRRIGYLPESFVTYDNLTGLEVLHLFADLKHVPRSACAGVLEQVGMSLAAGRRVHTYSKGMRQRLGFAQALLGDPDLIFLDEPTNGLDPEGIADFYRILREVRERGSTIVITSHILAEIQDRVDRLVIMHSGKIAEQGTLAQLRSRMVLPSQIVATLRPGTADQLQAALAPLDGPELRLDGAKATIACQSGEKMAVLAVLAKLALDVTIHEPTLEQLFLGHGGAHVHAH
ncbi:ABC transporter ATP-binding protein [Rugamonas apoptosis]|uniref:ABC transporter ATP-binding protein n=1 Tax=Rugamonas apoptosis TaxID=2758570 RepID=A0A7W2F815_9BURK|nr:ABC transporter ATP-binding protein [Rugamonas apoptosis]MBA5686828.1 ABC transporter ATP-binding protein [Rugamonas apoptosis]